MEVNALNKQPYKLGCDKSHGQGSKQTALLFGDRDMASGETMSSQEMFMEGLDGRGDHRGFSPCPMDGVTLGGVSRVGVQVREPWGWGWTGC